MDLVDQLLGNIASAEDIDTLLMEYGSIKNQIVALEVKQNELKEKIQEGLKTAKKSSYQYKNLKAEVRQKVERSIDPKELLSKLNELNQQKLFLDCIKVQLTQTEKIVPKTILEGITVTKKGNPYLEIKSVKGS